MTELTVTADDFAQALRSAGVGQVFLPGEPGYDAARTPWNLAVEQLPAAVVVPTTATEVANAVRVSAAAGLRVVAQSTGQGAGHRRQISAVGGQCSQRQHQHHTTRRAYRRKPC